MAARTVKIRHDEETRFYVYRLFDRHETVYIGKGSGRRLEVQQAKFQLPGEVVKRFAREADAYAYEVQLISDLRPTRNIHPGGNGNKASKRRIPKWLSEMNKIGTRAYGARLLLKFTRPCPTKRMLLEAIAKS